MTRVWFDFVSHTIVIDGVSPHPARSLVPSIEGSMVWAREPSGRGVFALDYTQLQTSDGAGFASQYDALAYITEVFTQGFSIDAGVV
jgi:hypothetical protein